MSKATECNKYCSDLDNTELLYLKEHLNHITEEKRIYGLMPDLRVLKSYVVKEVYKRGLENDK